MVKITPRMPKVPKSKEYEDMKSGEFFLSGDSLYIKCDVGNQDAVCIQDGMLHNEFCNFETIPVDVEIKWTRKPKVDKKGK